MQIYIEQTILINFIQNCLIIKLTSFFIKDKAKWIIINSLLSSIFTLILPIFNLNSISKILIQIPVATVMICLSFKIKTFSRFAYAFLSYFIFTFVLGGGCFALQQAIGNYPIFIVNIVGLGLYIIVKLLIYQHNKMQRIKSFTYDVLIKANGKEIKENGYLDSGNVLIDVITKQPIILINFEVFRQIYGDISLIKLISKSIDKKLNGAHYIKLNSIGSGSNVLAFVVDEIVLNNQQSFKNPTLALTFSGFEKSFKANVLLNSQMIFGG